MSISPLCKPYCVGVLTVPGAGGVCEGTGVLAGGGTGRAVT